MRRRHRFSILFDHVFHAAHSRSDRYLPTLCGSMPTLDHVKQLHADWHLVACLVCKDKPEYRAWLSTVEEERAALAADGIEAT